jgi:hypothetical protein
MLGDNGFDEVAYAVRHRPPTSLALLEGRIATLESSGKDFLSCYPDLVKRHPTIRANGKFAQLRVCPYGAVEYHKDFASLWRDLDPKTGASLIPIDNVLRRSRESVNDTLAKLRTRHRAGLFLAISSPDR